MTERWLAIAAVMGIAVISTIFEHTDNLARSPLTAQPQRQNIDAMRAALDSTTSADSSTVMISAERFDAGSGQHANTEPGPSPDQVGLLAQPPADFDLDVPHLQTSFGTRDLDQLLTNGHTHLDLPDGSRAELQLVDQRTRHGMTTIRVRHADLISTITRRGERYFATIATPRDSYRIEGNESTGRIYPHRMLAARTIRNHKDYRHAP